MTCAKVRERKNENKKVVSEKRFVQWKFKKKKKKDFHEKNHKNHFFCSRTFPPPNVNLFVSFFPFSTDPAPPPSYNNVDGSTIKPSTYNSFSIR